MVVNNMNRK
jgi:hypothetical protein